GSAGHFRRGFVVDDFPSAAFDASEGGAGTVVVEALGPESAPVVGSDLIQGGDNIVEGVGLDHRSGGGRAVEEVAEIVDALGAFGLLADDDVGPEPVEGVFGIKIGA